MKEKLMEIKKDMKKRKPKFMAQDAHKKSRVKPRWRKPRGLDSKMRKQLKGYRRVVKQGYMTPADVKDYNKKHGLKIVNVETIKDLENIDIKEQGIIISLLLVRKRKSKL